MSLIEANRRLESKIDSLTVQVNEMDKTLVRNTTSLEDHMRRTEILENRLSPGKIVGVIGGMVAIVLGILKIAALLHALQ